MAETLCILPLPGFGEKSWLHNRGERDIGGGRTAEVSDQVDELVFVEAELTMVGALEREVHTGSP